MPGNGDQYERKALIFLQQKGLQLLDSNYRCRQGEIDLILMERHTLVFVEVRYRNSQAFGSSAESINRKKQLKIIKTAEHYLHAKQLWNANTRFDVIAIDGVDKESKRRWFSRDKIHWIKAAFDASDF